MATPGKCELCGKLRALRDSHYLPKAAYKRNRAGQLKNPNPVVIVAGKAKQSSSQIKAYKFCDECEDRLNKNGESWVLSNIATVTTQGTPFEIQNILPSNKAVDAGPGLLIFREQDVAEIDFDKLVYFALSVFWRGTLNWPVTDGGAVPKVKMNSRQEAASRRFLLGKGGLPPDMVLTIAIWPFKSVPPGFLVPREDAGFYCRRYWFYFGGFIFSLALGNAIQLGLRKTCAYRKRILLVSEEMGKTVFEIFKNELSNADSSRIEETMKEVAAIKTQPPKGTV